MNNVFQFTDVSFLYLACTGLSTKEGQMVLKGQRLRDKEAEKKLLTLEFSGG